MGSQKAIAVGLKYLNSKKQKSIITILNSDGEDDSSQIAHMIKEMNLILTLLLFLVGLKGVKGVSLIWFYILHKFLTFIFYF